MNTTMQHPYLMASAAITATLISPVLTFLYITWRRTSTLPPQIPWSGLKNKRILPKLRACLRDPVSGREPITEGYETYSKHGKPYILPGFLLPAVVLPPADTLWLATQRDDVVSNSRIMNEILALKYLSHGPDLAAQVDFTVLRRDLMRQASRLLSDVMDEMILAFDEELMDVQGEEWKEVKMFHVIESVSRRFNNRLFVGLPLCRDKRYISGLERWETCLGICSGVIRHLIPQGLQPIFAPVVAFPVRFQTWWLKRSLMPLIHQRASMRNNLGDSKGAGDAPNDVLQWLIDAKLDGKDSTGMTFDDIAEKAIMLNFFSIHTISINTSTILSNILLSPSSSNLTTTLRTEALSILPTLAQKPLLIRNMTKLDSVIRESMRVSNMTGRGFDREIVSPTGVTTPSGVYLPKGARVCVAVSPRQMDAEVWERGEEFVPLRFHKGEDEGDEKAAVREQGRLAVHVTEDFLSFGLGRHACPGRFFAVQMMKIILGHLLTNYDFEPLTEKPKFYDFSDATIPSPKATLKMRRRRQYGDGDSV